MTASVDVTQRAELACEQVRQAERELRIALAARSAAIMELHQAGMTVRAIAQVVGITHSRVAVILRGL